MTRPIRTLKDFRDTARAIHAYCSHYWVCSHDAQLRLEILAVHLGWAFDFFLGETIWPAGYGARHAAGITRRLRLGTQANARNFPAAMEQGWLFWRPKSWLQCNARAKPTSRVRCRGWASERAVGNLGDDC